MNQDRLKPTPDDAITDAAAHWCMRLHADDCTAAEREAFLRWQAADPRHADEYQAMLEIWQTADLLPRTATIMDVNPAAIAIRRRRNWRPLASAAAIALAGCHWRAGSAGNRVGCPIATSTSKRLTTCRAWSLSLIHI